MGKRLERFHDGLFSHVVDRIVRTLLWLFLIPLIVLTGYVLLWTFL